MERLLEQFAEFKRRPEIGQVVVRDSLGNPWAICEFIRLSSAPDDLRGDSLVAQSGGVTRRFWDFPRNWRDISACELLTLIEGPARRLRKS